MDQGETVLGLRVEDPELLQVDQPPAGHPFEDIGPDRAGVGLAPAHRQHYAVVITGKLQAAEVAIGVHTLAEEFVPGHLKAAEGGLVHGEEAGAGQIRQGLEILPVMAGENDAAEVVETQVAKPVVEGGEAGDAITHLQVDVDARVDEDEVDELHLDELADPGKGQGQDREAVTLQDLGQIVGGGLPVLQGQLTAAMTKHANPHLLDRLGG